MSSMLRNKTKLRPLNFSGSNSNLIHLSWKTDLLTFFCYCVVPENIQTPTTEGIGNSEGVGGSMAQEIPKGRGVLRPNSLPDGREND